MHKEQFLRYKDKLVTINLTTDFRLTGVIVEIYDDCLMFKTTTKESIINFDSICGIVTER